MTDNLSRVALRKSKIIYLSQPLYLLQRVRIFVEPLKLVVNGASLKLVRQSLHVEVLWGRVRGQWEVGGGERHVCMWSAVRRAQLVLFFASPK